MRGPRNMRPCKRPLAHEGSAEATKRPRRRTSRCRCVSTSTRTRCPSGPRAPARASITWLSSRVRQWSGWSPRNLPRGLVAGRCAQPERDTAVPGHLAIDFDLTKLRCDGSGRQLANCFNHGFNNGHVVISNIYHLHLKPGTTVTHLTW